MHLKNSILRRIHRLYQILGKFIVQKRFRNNFFFFSGLHPRHMEIPRWGVLNQSYSGQPTPQPQQHRVWATSVPYTTAQGNARSLTHWVRLGIKPESSWILVGFVITEPQWELLVIRFLTENSQTPHTSSSEHLPVTMEYFLVCLFNYLPSFPVNHGFYDVSVHTCYQPF